MNPRNRADPLSRERRRVLSAFGAGAVAWTSSGAVAADVPYPSRPITLMVPFAAGGIADITARTVAKAMSARLGQPIIVDNRPSAGSIVASAAVAKAAPDGYTLLLISNGNAVSARLFKKLPYDVTRDFAPVGTLGFFDLGIVVDAKSPLKSVADLVREGKAHPGKLNIGTIAVGSTQHLSAALFKTVTGIDALLVPYNGSPALLTALRSGDVDVAFEIMGPLMGQVRSQALRVLAVTSERRFALLPDVPTVRESGFPAYVAASWNGLAAPTGTPPAVVARLNAAANEALKTPEVVGQLQSIGVRPQGGSADDLQRLLVAEIRRWGDVITAAKIEPQ